MVFGVAAASFVGSLSKRFRTPSEKRAKSVLGGVVSAALSGNLLAVKVLDERRNGGAHPAGISKERAVWDSGYQQVASKRPDLIAAYRAASLPDIDHSSPEAAARSVNSSVALYQPNPVEQLTAPLVTAAQVNEATTREAVAQTIERAGIGGGAALAKSVRGTEGPLDKVIEFGQKPGGAIALGVGVLFAFFVIGRLLK